MNLTSDDHHTFEKDNSGPPTTKLPRADQARINGSKSHGPKTESGKAISSQNALKHGFCARVPLFGVESDPQWGLYLSSYIRAFRPLNQPEMDAVEQLAESRWRRKRAVNVETTLLNLALGYSESKITTGFDNDVVDGCLRIAVAWKEECGDRAYELARRYIVSAERSYSRAFSELRNLQGKRFQSTPEPEFTVADSSDIAVLIAESTPPETAGESSVPADDDQQQQQQPDNATAAPLETVKLRNEPRLVLPLETYFVPLAYANLPLPSDPLAPETGGSPIEPQRAS